MGWVWNVLLSCSNEEFWEDGERQARETCEPLERINQWIPHGRLVSLIAPTYAKGVGNGMDAHLFGGGYRRFDIEGFIKVVEAQDWQDRERVQLWVKGAEEGMGEESFTAIRLRRRPLSRPKRLAKRSPSKPRLKTRAKYRRAV
jgi:hypothetical protein